MGRKNYSGSNPCHERVVGISFILIHQQNEDLFSNIKDIPNLKQFKIGQGAQWTTIIIALKELGFKVVTKSDYEGLFNMLIKGRFDLFPHGINEIFQEYEATKTNFLNWL